MRPLCDIVSLLALEITAVVLAAAAGIYALASFDSPDWRVAVVLLAPAVEASLPLVARARLPRHLHTARVLSVLLVAFYVALVPGGVDRRVYLPALSVLVVVWLVSTRQRLRGAAKASRKR
jgi:hypothetical protein